MAFDLPRTLTLPSGRRLTIEAARRSGGERTQAEAAPAPNAPLFADVVALFDREVQLHAPRKGESIDVHDLALADFHVLRGVLTKAGLVPEDEVEVDCHNCGELIVVRPCEALETGPWEDGEADDPELDQTAALDAPLAIAPIPIGRVRVARTITLRPRTVREAAPLFAALASDPLRIDEAVVIAMGVKELGPIEAPDRIAQALTDCDDEAFESVTNAFLAAHYPLRLASDAFCPKCKARNTIDAPALREFERSDSGASVTGAALDRARTGETGPPLRPLPPLAEFVDLAHAIAEPLIAEIPGDKAELVVDDGVPAVDDGGEPLLGSYVPPPPRDAPVPTRPPVVTIYYRTFAAIEREEGPFDWEYELRETIEHELEHHVYFLRGDDPMDAAEHEEIDREALRVVGKAEATRRTLAVFGGSIPDFVRRAWPLLLIGAAVLAISLAEGRCGP